jgi:branched-chain amino acid transport system ATP-binding protein
MKMSNPLLNVENLAVAYGHIQAVRGVSFFVNEDEIVTLIGANGAGKTTILNTISGLVRAASGRITFDGQDITHWSSSRLVRSGIVQVPEGREILGRLTVLENLQLGALHRRDARQVQRDLDGMFDRFPDLARFRTLRANVLSGGQQQMLAIGRALMARPRLLLMDEPSLGLAPQLVNRVFQFIQSIHTEGTTILLVEQNALKALRTAHRAYVVETGKIRLSGTGAELLDNDEVRRAYLGQTAH